MKRCEWAQTPSIMRTYHDKEWGVPLTNDRKLFEFLILEGMQAGLSWLTVLKKRENFRKAFDRFDPKKVAHYGTDKVRSLLEDAGIIRNRLKIDAAVSNARSFLAIQEEAGSFSPWMWSLINKKPIQNHWKRMKNIPCQTQDSDRISKVLKERGFRFVGSTIIYAHMQATGMVNDHLVSCYRYPEINRLGKFI
jgi:DNA-3-methyladenine glycosylase I